MARKEPNITTRTGREALKPQGKPYFRMVAKGVALGYRKPLKGAGAWVVRKFVGGTNSTIETLKVSGQTIVADDLEQANGANVMNYKEALAFVTAEKNESVDGGRRSYTVERACADYIAFLQSEGRNAKAVSDAQGRINAFILPHFSDREVADLKAEQLRKWRTDLAKVGPRIRTGNGEKQKYRTTTGNDADRARKASANRNWTTLRAILNHAFRENRVASDAAWRRVKPFNNVEAARVRYLTIEESRRLVNACEGDFRLLVQAALQTGARYGQLAGLKVSDFNATSGTLDLRTRKGNGTEKSYVCVLSDEGTKFFRQVCAGKPRDDLMFRKADGEPWMTANQQRLMKAACKRSAIKPLGFHQTRHTWASLSMMAGIPDTIIARNLGHTDTKMVQKHYGHLAPSYVADVIRKSAPRYGVAATNIKPLAR